VRAAGTGRVAMMMDEGRGRQPSAAAAVLPPNARWRPQRQAGGEPARSGGAQALPATRTAPRGGGAAPSPDVWDADAETPQPEPPPSLPPPSLPPSDSASSESGGKYAARGSAARGRRLCRRAAATASGGGEQARSPPSEQAAASALTCARGGRAPSAPCARAALPRIRVPA